MSETNSTTPIERVLPEIFSTIANRLPTAPSPLVGYAVTVVIIELILQTARTLEGYPPFYLVSPLSLLRPVLLIGAALVTQRLHERYYSAVEEMNLRKRAENPDQFGQLVPSKLAWVVIGIGIVFTLGNNIFIVSIAEMSTWAVADILQRNLIVPFGYAPIFGMFLTTYVAIEVVVPRRIAQSDVGLYYHDPEGLGGMRPVGELIKHTYYFLLIGLVIYAIALYGPHILGGVFKWSSGAAPGVVTNAMFTAVWAASVAVMMYGIHTLHQFMRRQKREKLQQLDAQARDHINEPWNVEGFDVPDDVRETYDDIRTRQGLVAATREYPATFTMWIQFAVGIIIPKAVQLLLAAV